MNPGTAKIPDHSKLTCIVNLSCAETLQNEFSAKYEDNETLSYGEQPSFRTYEVRNIPQDILSDDISTDAIESIIYKLENENIAQREIDAICTNLVDVIHLEIDRNLNYWDIRAGADKRKRHFTKTWWCEDLRELWDKVRQSENAFLLCKDNRSKQSLRTEYVLARKQFDKNLCQSESQYYA